MSTNNKHKISEKELDNLLGQAFLNLDFNNPKNEELMETISTEVMQSNPAYSTIINRSLFTKAMGILVLVAAPIMIWIFFFNTHTNQLDAAIKNSGEKNATPPPVIEKKPVTNEHLYKTEEKTISEATKQLIAGSTPEQTVITLLNEPQSKQNHDILYPENKKVKPEDTGYVFPKLTEKEIKATKKQKLAMAMWLVKPKGKYSVIASKSSSYMNGMLKGYIKDTSSAFYMQNNEVTNLEYRTFLFDLLLQDRKEEFLIAKPHQHLWLAIPHLKHPEKMKDLYFSDKRFDNYPVLNITPEGAELYCKWLEETGKIQRLDLKARLPYENEWMRAARTKSHEGNYTWGSDSMQNRKGCFLANFCIKKQNERLNPRISCDPKKYPNAYTSAGLMLGDSVLPVEVYAYNPNDFGLYCITGNAAEMVYDNKTKNVKTKGGSWNSDLDACKITSEETLNGSVKANPMTGFRPVFKLLPKDNFGDMHRDDPETGLPALTNEEIVKVAKEKKKMIDALIRLNKDKYAFIPMGSFLYRKDTVSVQSFYMQTTEVTNLEYRTFLADLLIQGRNSDYLAAKPDQMMWVKRFPYSYNEPMANLYFWHPAYDEYPVVNISRKGVELYCNWLTIETNKALKESNKPLMNDLRLPVDLEWAYAASNGKNEVKYANGNTFLRDSKGKYEVNYMCYSKEECRYDSALKLYVPKVFKQQYIDDGGFHTVYTRSYEPNNYGLFCMGGNAAEMVSTYNKQSNTYLKKGVKGGSWFSCDYFLEIDAEDEYPGEIGPSPLIGFRPVFTTLKK